MVIGIKLKKLRKQRRFTQEYFAEKLQISQATLSNIESGKTNPSLNVIKAACKELGVDFMELIDDQKVDITNSMGQGRFGEENSLVNQKLIEQYEARISELQERVAELKETLALWKSKAGYPVEI